MSDNPSPDFILILQTLIRHQVDFIIVGGVSAVLQGVPVTTLDLDIVHERSKTNVERLLLALEELDAVSRLDSRGLRPNHSHLSSDGHQLLMTRGGPLDALGVIAGDLSFEDLVHHTASLALGDSEVLVLSLEKLIEIKRIVGRPKDLLAIPLIEHTMFEKIRTSKAQNHFDEET